MSEIPTVKIKVTPCDGNEEGVVIINQADFDPEKHELVGAEKKDGAGKGEKGHGKNGDKDKDKDGAGKGEK